jgi:hypothetical protein
LNDLVVEFLIASGKYNMLIDPEFLSKMGSMDEEKWGNIFSYYIWGKLPQQVVMTSLYLTLTSVSASRKVHSLRIFIIY